jgi:hypothetical protein
MKTCKEIEEELFNSISEKAIKEIQKESKEYVDCLLKAISEITTLFSVETLKKTSMDTAENRAKILSSLPGLTKELGQNKKLAYLINEIADNVMELAMAVNAKTLVQKELMLRCIDYEMQIDELKAKLESNATDG